MKSEREAQNRRASVVYPLVVSAVTAAATVGLAVLAARNLRLAWWANALDCVMIGGVSFLAARIGAACAGGFGRKTLIGLGVLGMAISVATCAWVFHRSSFELTEDSYRALDAAKVPADLIAELKNAEGAAADTEQQFVSDLSGRFGQNHIAPYREALVRSGWNIHRREALAAMLGACVCFSLTAGAAAAPRAKRG